LPYWQPARTSKKKQGGKKINSDGVEGEEGEERKKGRGE